MLKANLCPGKFTEKRGQAYDLSCLELGISVESHTASNDLCRKIMEVAPERGPESLEVYRGGKLAYTVRCIEDWATKTIIQSDKGGLRVGKYQPMPKQAQF